MKTRGTKRWGRLPHKIGGAKRARVDFEEASTSLPVEQPKTPKHPETDLPDAMDQPLTKDQLQKMVTAMLKKQTL